MTAPSLLILFGVFLAVALRQTLRIPLPIWQIMTLGAAANLLTAQIGPVDALRCIDADIMIFLFGMFVIGAALEESGFLAHLGFALFRRAATTDQLVLIILFGTGATSALLMNDTLAIVGTPVVIALARQHGLPPRLLLMALAFAITTGSVMSPIGNPQNLLIAIDGPVPNPFVIFLRHLGVPTVLSLLAAYLVLRWLYRGAFHRIPLMHVRDPVKDPALAAACRVALGVLLALVGLKIALVTLGRDPAFRLSHIALASALPVLVMSPRRWELVRKVDWPTLVFFAALFIVMQSVWDAGVLQARLADGNYDLTGRGFILTSGLLVSQLLSNVPWVALYLPVLTALQAGPPALLALAAGSTLAGNLLLLGAASNVILVQNAERRFGETLPFWEFARAGLPLTCLQATVYWMFL